MNNPFAKYEHDVATADFHRQRQMLEDQVKASFSRIESHMTEFEIVTYQDAEVDVVNMFELNPADDWIDLNVGNPKTFIGQLKRTGNGVENVLPTMYRWPRDVPGTINLHIHHSLEVGHIIQGELVFYMQGREFVYVQGQQFTIQAETPHHVVAAPHTIAAITWFR